ncbi:hypothetical protein BSIN_5101 [Burkholderia singularis]|uniref:Uncharacterized protein n=1 Tax=Burkholderia singularis TaxID=1503053 RepID=A0A238HBR6_9BURK|nr:hypothetical protein BSIN_5101 [Burkholderia singularis]
MLEIRHGVSIQCLVAARRGANARARRAPGGPRLPRGAAAHAGGMTGQAPYCSRRAGAGNCEIAQRS